MTVKRTESVLQNFLLPKGWRVKKTTHYKLYCPLAKTGFKIDFLEKKKLSAKQALAKAIGFKNQALEVLDTTGGWLKDAFLMADMGCQVKAMESHPFVFHFSKASLDDFYLQNSKFSGSTPSYPQKPSYPRKRVSKAFYLKNFKLSGSLELFFGDSVYYLNSLKNYADYPDVIFIDPMFGGRKKSTSKKELRILQQLTHGHDNKQEIFKSALSKAKQRVVVKRHKLEKPLKPNALFCFKGQSICYDVFQPIRS